VSVICELPPTVNFRRTLITPIVGIVDASFEPRANNEVSQVFRLPLDRFLSCNGHSSFIFNTDGHMVHFFEDYIEGVMFFLVYCLKYYCVFGKLSSNRNFFYKFSVTLNACWGCLRSKVKAVNE